MVSIYDLAKRAGVSASTVSRALRDHPRIGAETRARIKDLAADLGYSPSYAARSLSMQRTMTIGVIIHDVADPYIGSVLRAIEDSAFDSGFNVILSSTQDSRIREAAVADTLRQGRVDGIVMVSSHLDEDYHVNLGDVQIPTVLINETVSAVRPAPGLGLVTIDEIGATRKLVEHLIALGHERIGYVGNRRTPRSTRDRIAGYEDALTSAGIETDPHLVVELGAADDTQVGEQGTASILSRRPTAIVYYNDMTAIGGMTLLKRQGMRLPEQMSVCGFDDIDFARHLSPSLTSIAQPKYEIGAKAMEVLLDLISGEGKDFVVHSYECHLTVRESTAPPHPGVAGPNPAVTCTGNAIP